MENYWLDRTYTDILIEQHKNHYRKYLNNKWTASRYLKSEYKQYEPLLDGVVECPTIYYLHKDGTWMPNSIYKHIGIWANELREEYFTGYFDSKEEILKLMGLNINNICIALKIG